MCGQGESNLTDSVQVVWWFLLLVETTDNLSDSPDQRRNRTFVRFLRWCGQGESDPRLNLGKVSLYHLTMAAMCFYMSRTASSIHFDIFRFRTVPPIIVFPTPKCNVFFVLALLITWYLWNCDIGILIFFDQWREQVCGL